MPYSEIQKAWKIANLPELDEELSEFLEYLAVRCSPSLKRVNYEEFCKAFEDGWTIPEHCQHDDEPPFDSTAEENDDQDLEAIARLRAQNASPEEESPEKEADQEEEPEIDSDDLMVFIDEALFKIVSKLPAQGTKKTLNAKLLPITKATIDEERNEKVLVLQP